MDDYEKQEVYDCLLIYLQFLYTPPKNIVSKSVAAYKNTESTMF